jgi:lysophosphatidylcholine acyltransferase/lyso-PAF acetyltransferase
MEEPKSQQKEFDARPFTSTTPATKSIYESLKLLIMLPVVLVKLAIGLGFVGLMWLFSFIGSFTSHPKTRTLIQDMIRVLSRMMLAISFGFWNIKIKDLRSPVQKAKETKDLPKIWVSKHCSAVDAWIFMSMCRVGVLGKSDIFEIPVVGRICTFMDCIALHRDLKDGTKNKEGVSKAKQLLIDHANSKDKLALVVFPEATTTHPDYLIKFMHGAFSTKKPVNMVNLDFQNNKHWDVYYGVSTWLWLLRCLSQVYVSVSIDWLGVYEPTEMEQLNPDIYAENVRQLIGFKCGYKLSNMFRHDLVEWKRNKTRLD